MTSVFLSHRPGARRWLRITAAATGLAGALALTACSGGGSGDDAATSPSPSTASSASSSSSSGTGDSSGESGSGSGGSAADRLAGSWLATTDGKAVALVVTGKQAALFATGGSVCSGTAGEQSGKRMIRLKCTDGSKDRTTGMVDSVTGSTLKITWQGGRGEETYTKAEGGKLPTGLPTAGLG